MAEHFNSIIVPVTQHFLKNANVDFTRKSIKQSLENNPYYPSLYSIKNVLTRLNIDNKALEVEDEQLEELPVPFLAYYTIDGHRTKDFVSVTAVLKNSIHYYDGQEKKVTKEEFLSNWSKIVLLAQPDGNSREKNYENNKKTEFQSKLKNGFIVIGFLLFLFVAIYHYLKQAESVFSSGFLLISNIIGLTASVFLLVFEMDKSNIFVKNICTGGAKVDCNAVLSSKGSKIGGVSWSEIGFLYFSIMCLYILLPGTALSEKKMILSYIFLLSAAYIPFSIFYQLYIVKQWCKFCLFIQLVLATNLVWAFSEGSFNFILSIRNVPFLASAITLPILLWYTVKPIITKAQNSERFLSAYKRLYANPEVFNITIAGEPTAPAGWQHLGGIEKGNTDATTIILKVCSPACGHCDKAHRLFNELLTSDDSLKIITVYDVYNEEFQNENLQLPVKHFLGLKALGREGELIKAMDYWYLTPDRTYNELKKMYPVSEEIIQQQQERIKKMSEWCNLAEIAYTPTVYLNGRRLPSSFELTDLKYVLS